LTPFCVVQTPGLQNPDPKAAAYFAAYISKAYAALTDDVSRQNYEKYGHPDGPQVRAGSVAAIRKRQVAVMCAINIQQATKKRSGSCSICVVIGRVSNVKQRHTAT
jgi:DnaJ-class molecular chaperone